MTPSEFGREAAYLMIDSWPLWRGFNSAVIPVNIIFSPSVLACGLRVNSQRVYNSMHIHAIMESLAVFNTSRLLPIFYSENPAHVIWTAEKKKRGVFCEKFNCQRKGGFFVCPL